LNPGLVVLSNHESSAINPGAMKQMNTSPSPNPNRQFQPLGSAPAGAFHRRWPQLILTTLALIGRTWRKGPPSRRRRASLGTACCLTPTLPARHFAACRRMRRRISQTPRWKHCRRTRRTRPMRFGGSAFKPGSPQPFLAIKPLTEDAQRTKENSFPDYSA
jgi:hypothetical protein